MTSIPTAKWALSRLGTVAVAVGLACSASGALAAAASVANFAFTVDTVADPSVFVFAPTDFQGLAWDLRAQDGGGLFGEQARNGSATSWDNVDQTAVTSKAKATVSSSTATDPFTLLNTPKFTLAAEASRSLGYPLGTPANRGSGSFVSSGIFCFGNGDGFDGTSAGCNAAGQLTLTVYYDLLVSILGGGAEQAESSITLHVANADGSVSSFQSDFASAGSTGSLHDRFLTFTIDLGAGDAAFFDLTGTVLATAVPEPSMFALTALGLGLVAGSMRRRRTGVATSQA